MTYEVFKIEDKIVNKAGSRNNGQHYCVIHIEDPISGDTREVPVFDIEAKRYAPFIGKEAELPQNLKTWMFCFDEEFVFPSNKPMVQMDDNGLQPRRNKFGQMYQRTSVSVLTRYYRDEEWLLLHPDQSPLRPKKGWDLVSRGTSVMNAFYVPLESVLTQTGPTMIPGAPDPGQPAPAQGAPAPANIPV